MDSTDLSGSEASRLSNDAQLAFLAAHSPDLILVISEQGGIQYSSASARRLLQREPERLVGTALRRLLHPDDLPDDGDVVAMLRRMTVRRGADEDSDLRFQTASDEWCWFSVNVCDLTHTEPVNGVLVVARDIDERRKQEDRMRLLERGIEAANNSICIAENTGDLPLTYVNDGFVQLTQYSREEALGRNCRFLQYRPDGTRDDDQEGIQQMSDAIEAGRFARVDLRNYKKDGTPLYLELYVTPVHNDEGAVTHFVGVQSDVTERVAAERRYKTLARELEARVEQRTERLEEQKMQLEAINEDLREARDRAEAGARVKSDFLANMSHEIRTPLTGIIGFASMLSERVGPDLRHLAERIERAGARLLETLNLVLDLSQLDAGKRPVSLTPQLLYPEVEDLVRLFQPRASAKGLLLTLAAQPRAEEARAWFDRAALTGVLNNLVGNAIKFTDQGEVSIEVGLAPLDPGPHAEGSVFVRVSDTGRGITPAFVPHLFEPFSQESTGLNRTHEGSGLGLSIVKRLADLLGAEVTVQSVPLRGSTFTVYLRYHSQLDGSHLDAYPYKAEPEHPSARLLVVEDNLDSQYLLKMVLEDLCPVDVASSASEALALIAETPYTAIFMDVNLGSGPTGVDVLQKLRALPSLAHTPVIALTAYALPGDGERLLESGFTEYLPKPFAVEHLLERARAFVESTRVPGNGRA